MEDTIVSVGIDIGTSTTQLVFSRLILKNMASLVSVPQIKIMAKEVIFTSEVHQTPLLSATEIDSPAVRAIVEAEYKRAGMTPEHVDTGAVIITGETARKSNASEVLKTLSGLAGEFVVATAGPALESIIAGKGAHADALSRERGAVVANLDIGGGTTNIAVFKNGEVIDTCCMDIGGRLVKFNEKGCVSYSSHKVGQLAQHLGLSLSQMQPLSTQQMQGLAEAMATILAQVLGCEPATELTRIMATDRLLSLDYAIDYISFSGGVAECMNQENSTPYENPLIFGDLGVYLGRALAQSAIGKRYQIVEAEQTIRATVVGAGSHTTSISGSTISYASQALPLQNLPVLKFSAEEEALPYWDWEQAIGKKLHWFALEEEQQVPALAFRGPKAPGFDAIQEIAGAIIRAMGPRLEPGVPLVVVVENDLAKALGQALQAITGPTRLIVCIDAIAVNQGDYIDIGTPVAHGNVVPVIVKTLALGY
ncbi:ethanolamine ammonia-lyase reactivating factor EutA [Desulfobulbus rhabdoformis]|uniref:ethanolamine ammonia-lyase reactivating factor EutA n=1 Tax=Desulfobulbus rhabdoformis TaxID=34032 RepID=UPI00196428C4|nr:ethanolamine ammonia-lyase reactivating factor EutA [Desulfobulbus rhabdoformis]MBM9613743.1 ethanolamine ammonia-lyase reactivating factor EutA [Desulfobulbus rhabdoformis]